MALGSFSHLQPGALADAIFPVSRRNVRLIRDIALIVGFTLLTALFAQISIPLGFTPVPITGQTLAVMLTGAALGSRRGAAAMALYLVAGAWLPFFAGGASGFVWGLATGGYLVGFIPAAYLVGFLAERGWDRRVWIILAMLLGNIVLYLPGLVQLSFFVPEGKVLELGLYPFILGDLIKIYIAALTLPTAWWLIHWNGRRSATSI
ncbi:MAG TPA: biotin transporter BioY [Dehalococcoidia bacterium]|nr:biotin transporter BioY [Dehalococcoidia bacterium]